MGGQWLLPEVEGLTPPPRGGHACVSVGSKVILFGGSDRAPLTFDDLWMLETADGKFEWTRISPSFEAGCSVHPRSGSSLTAVGDKVYLFGGQEPLTEFRFGDMKVLDTSSWTWADVQVQGTSPPPRHSHIAACLAGQCMLVYGGSGYQGTLSDIWIFNTAQSSWTRPSPSGQPPAAREMHCGCMVDSTNLLVYGGRSADGRVLCDAALFDAKEMQWKAIEPTPFSRCAHSGIFVPSDEEQAGTSASGPKVLVYGGFSGEAVEGDVLAIDSKTLEIEHLRRGPREADKVGSVPRPRFAHAAAAIPWTSGGGKTAMVVFGGVTPAEDLNDLAVWSPS